MRLEKGKWRYTASNKGFSRKIFPFRYDIRNMQSSYRLTLSDARPHLMHDFTKSSITYNSINISLINIILALINFFKLNN